MGCGQWPDIDWDLLSERHSAQPSLLHRYVDPDDHGDLASYVGATQRYQGELLKYHIELLRRSKYAPTGGFALFQFADAYPAVTWSILDADREPKLGYRYVRDACADVIVCAQWPAATYAPGEQVALDLYVVSDLRRPLHDLELEASLGAPTHRYRGEVDADSTAHAGRFTAPAPPAPGTYRLELSLCDSGGNARHQQLRRRSRLNPWNSSSRTPHAPILGWAWCVGGLIAIPAEQLVEPRRRDAHARRRGGGGTARGDLPARRPARAGVRTARVAAARPAHPHRRHRVFGPAARAV